MRLALKLGYVLSTLCCTAVANVEKAIFLGPVPANIPSQSPTISDLNLQPLTPANNSIRTKLERVFPTDTLLGQATWLLLDNLTEGQRYEIRVCWSAIEPTSFDMDVHELDTVWETPELIQSLAEYASSRQLSSEDAEPRIHQDKSDDSGEKASSVLLLRVLAAADYFTDNAELMENPPPVLVDIILDPFIYNILPRSLVPTGGYIIAVAIVTWLVAQYIASYLGTFSKPSKLEKKKQ